MKKLLTFAVAAFIGVGMLAHDAEAKRLGGGGSFGMSRSTAPVQKAAPAPSTPANAAPAPSGAAAPAAPAPKPAGASRWLGPLAGLAAGIGLAALLSHFGMGEGMANFLLIALLLMGAVFIFRRFFGNSQNSQPSRYASLAGAGAGTGAPMRLEPVAAPVGGDGAATANVPSDFDTEGFLRQAKLSFIRLQAANDAGNFDDLKQFLAPEIFAEIQLQYEARGKSKQETDVQQLDANLLEVVTEGNQHIASVRFSGTIREDREVPAAFAEIWHLVKPVSGERGWQVAGIQQIQ
jgi:predicted lipid-binding transport protein (Tim44 family)